VEIVAWLRGDANYVLVLGMAQCRAPTIGETEMNEYTEKYGKALEGITRQLSMALDDLQMAEQYMHQHDLRRVDMALSFAYGVSKQAYKNIDDLHNRVTRDTQN